MTHGKSIKFIEKFENPAKRIALSKDEVILIDLELTEAQTANKIRSLQRYKKRYEDIILQAEAEINATQKRTPLSTDHAAGGPDTRTPLERLAAILIERGENVQCKRNSLFTGSRYYIVKAEGEELLNVLSASGTVVFGSSDPATVARYLEISDVMERERTKLQPVVDKIRDFVEVQGRPGNYDQNDYMLGVYNGLELALATLENRDPVYKKMGESEK